MAELERAVAALRITSVDLVPSTISTLLGCEPTTSWAKNTRVPLRHPNSVLRHVETPGRRDKPADLEAQVAEILDRLTPDESVWAELVRPRRRALLRLVHGPYE
ncbi:MAG TPA: DUF4279 domain-containing protein [Nocardioides sp.]|nr:DUF4279 domain-containing protein [Nocardioides sp.]